MQVFYEQNLLFFCNKILTTPENAKFPSLYINIYTRLFYGKNRKKITKKFVNIVVACILKELLW